MIKIFVLVISQSSYIMGWLGSKSRSLGQILEKSNLIYTLGATFLVQSSSKLVRMFVLMISHCRSIFGWVESECRSLGQILENIVYTLGTTFLVQSSQNLIRMLVLMISKSSLIMDGAGSNVGHKVKSSLSLK